MSRLHPSLSLAETQVVIDKLQQPVNVFVKVLNVVMSSTIYPQWLDWVWTTLVDGTAVGEIYYLILLAMDHQHGRCYLLDLVNAASQYYGYMVRVYGILSTQTVPSQYDTVLNLC